MVPSDPSSEKDFINLYAIIAWFAEVVKLLFKHSQVEGRQNNRQNKFALPILTFIISDIRMWLILTVDKL